jgi:hypothetical protein
MTKHVLAVAGIVALMSVSGVANAAPATTGSWNVAGTVQGIPVNATCAFVETDMKITGSCVDDAKKSHIAVGSVKGTTVTWAYNSEYEGTPITITWTGTLDATGVKMAGTIAVDPFGVDGDFTATMGPATPAAAPAPAL